MEQIQRSSRQVRSVGSALALVTVLVLTAMTGCVGDKTAPTAQDSGQPANAEPAGSNAAPAAARGNGQKPVVVSGAVKGSFAVKNAWAADFPGDYRVQLDMDFLCSVFFNIPHETKPGTYPITDGTISSSDRISAEFDDACHQNADLYPSTTGTMTLTSTGTKWSGSFEFTGQNRKDKSKTVQVSGSFSDIPVK